VILVGTSGWQYRDWRGQLYPERLPQRLWLEHYATHFLTVEVNNAFYRLPERDTFAQWRERTPGGFAIAVKMSRYLTHIKRLRDPREPVERFLSHAEGLGAKLGPILMQLPPTLHADVGLLDEALGLFPKRQRVAVEPRHPSWWTDEIRKVLENHGSALCWADRRGRPVTPLWRTTSFVYVRLHEGRAHPRPSYGRAAIQRWLDRIGGDGDSYVYFNNDPGGAAVRDAQALIAAARRRGWPVNGSE
jgi:uncharacterized protein YecE (DUF72 family)